MKPLVLIVFAVASFGTQAQDSMEKVMQRRAKEMHRVICLSTKEDWKKFVRENYAQSLIDRQMKAKVDGPSGTTETTVQDNVEGKAMMLGRLHDEFGSSKIVSIKTEGETVRMELDNGQGMIGTFKLKFSKIQPYLIEGLGIEVGN